MLSKQSKTKPFSLFNVDNRAFCSFSKIAFLSKREAIFATSYTFFGGFSGSHMSENKSKIASWLTYRLNVHFWEELIGIRFEDCAALLIGRCQNCHIHLYAVQWHIWQVGRKRQVEIFSSFFFFCCCCEFSIWEFLTILFRENYLPAKRASKQLQHFFKEAITFWFDSFIAGNTKLTFIFIEDVPVIYFNFIFIFLIDLIELIELIELILVELVYFILIDLIDLFILIDSIDLFILFWLFWLNWLNWFWLNWFILIYFDFDWLFWLFWLNWFILIVLIVLIELIYFILILNMS